MVNGSSIWKFRSRIGYNTLRLQCSNCRRYTCVRRRPQPHPKPRDFQPSLATTAALAHRDCAARRRGRSRATRTSITSAVTVSPGTSAALGFVRISAAIRVRSDLAPLGFVRATRLEVELAGCRRARLVLVCDGARVPSDLRRRSGSFGCRRARVRLGFAPRVVRMFRNARVPLGYEGLRLDPRPAKAGAMN
jgi:hypothetical protein